MATRVRPTPGQGVKYTSLSYHSHWDATTSAVQRVMDVGDGKTVELLSVDSSNAVIDNSASRRSWAMAQFQSARLLKAQTISGTLKGQMQAMESDAAADMGWQVHARVVDPVANTTRGVLWAPDKTYTATSGTPGDHAYELATTRTNRKAPSGWTGSGVSLSSVDALDGDLLVIEVGFRSCNTVTTNYTCTCYFGGQAASDLPEDETATAVGTAWFEFSDDILFADGVDIQEWLELEVDLIPEILGAQPAVGQLWPRGSGRQ